MHFAGFGAIRRIHDRALFHLRDFAGDADHDARMHQHLAVVRLLDEVIQHLLGDFEVRDDAVFHRLDGDDIAGRAAQHFLGFLADRFDFAGGFVQRDDGRLVDDDAFTLGENEGIGGAKIDGKVGRKKTEKRPEVHLSDSKCKAGPARGLQFMLTQAKVFAG